MLVRGSTAAEIPKSLKSTFQDYDFQSLDLNEDASLIMQRTLEHGTWDEVRWLFRVYGRPQICTFIRQRGERLLSPVAFNYWRKLLGIRRWQRSPFPTTKGELWNR